MARNSSRLRWSQELPLLTKPTKYFTGRSNALLELHQLLYISCTCLSALWAFYFVSIGYKKSTQLSLIENWVEIECIILYYRKFLNKKIIHLYLSHKYFRNWMFLYLFFQLSFDIHNLFQFCRLFYIAWSKYSNHYFQKQ